MNSYSLSHLSDHVLLHDLATLVAQDRVTTAAMLAHLAEVDARRLYLPAAYASMYAWCVGELKLSEDSTAKRIQAARLARRFPVIFPMLADGRLHLSSVILLAPHLTPDNADDLLAAAAHQPKPALERLIAARFPRPDLPALVQPLAPASSADEHAPGHVILTVSGHSPAPAGACEGSLALAPVDERDAQHAPGHVPSHARLAPLAAGRFALQVTIAQETHDQLRYAQALLGHAVPSGDLAQVLDRALAALVAQLEQRRFARTARTRPSRRRRGEDSRYVPAAVRRAVWLRDGGQCTFVSEQGHRCEARTRLEFDHLDPFAQGGQATPARMRLLCRAHNQLAAERTYGAEFMNHKREAARQRVATPRELAPPAVSAAAELRAAEAAVASDVVSVVAEPQAAESAAASEVVRAAAEPRGAEAAKVSEAAPAPETARALARERAEAARSLDRERAAAAAARIEEVIPWLRALGVSLEAARRAAAPCADLPDGTPLEERVRAALKRLAPLAAKKVLHAQSAAA